MLREGAISYPALVQEKIRFAYHFAWLYVAGILHFFGITEQFRTRTAQCSLEVIGSLHGMSYSRDCFTKRSTSSRTASLTAW